MARLARPGLGLAVIAFVLMAYAGLALSSGMGRLGIAADHPLAGGAMRAASLKEKAATAIEGEDAALALVFANQAIEANPSDIEALSLLGTAHLSAHDRQAASKVFEISGNLGWRDLSTQLFWFDAAIRAEEWPVAAQRLDAVLRVQPSLPEMNALIGALETAGPAARSALAQRIKLRSSWRKIYLDGLSELDSPQLTARAQVLADTGSSIAGIGCAEIAPLTGVLTGISARREADAIWRRHCDPNGIGEPVFDPDFSLLSREGELPGFGWSIKADGDISVSVDANAQKEAGGAELVIENVGASYAVALSQRSDLPTGRYEMAALDAGGAVSQTVLVGVSCGGAMELPRAAVSQGESAIVSVPGDCSAQHLSLWVAPGNGKQSVSRITVTPAQ